MIVFPRPSVLNGMVGRPISGVPTMKKVCNAVKPEGCVTSSGNAFVFTDAGLQSQSHINRAVDKRKTWGQSLNLSLTACASMFAP